MRRRLGRFGRSVLAVTALLVVGTVVLASLPPRPFRSALTVIHTVSFRLATYWLVVVALVGVADRLAAADVAVTERTVRRLAAVVFVGALAIEASPLVRHLVDPAAVETTLLVEWVVVVVRAALFPAGLFLGTGLAALTLRDAAASGFGATPFPLAPDEGLRHESAPSALSRLVRVLAGVAALSAVLGVVGALAVRSDPYVALAVVEASLDALGDLFDHLVVGAALFALFVYGATLRSLAAAAAAVLSATFLLGLAHAIVGALAGVVVVGATLTPIPAVERAALVDWPDPLAWHTLVLVGSVVAACVGFRTIHGPLRGRPPDPSTGAANDSSDA